MIGRLVQRAALKLTCRHLPKLGACRDAAAAAVSLLPKNCVDYQWDIQQSYLDARMRAVPPRSLGRRCFSSDGTSSDSQEGGSEETLRDASSTGEASSNEERDFESSAEEDLGGGAAAEAGSEGTSEVRSNGVPVICCLLK